MESPQSTDLNRAIPMPVGLGLAALVSLLVFCWTHRAAACPFCGVAEVTLQKRIASFEISVVAEWQSGEAGDLVKEVPARTTFQVVSVLRGDAYASGAEIVIDRFHPGAPGELFLLNANHQEGTLAWDRATQLTERSYAYLRDAPTESISATDRLRHFIPWLEDAETLLANDAFNEFANAKYEDMVPLGQDLPRDRLRQWVFDPQTEPVRIGVYGMLLGLCGEEADALLMEQKILEQTAPTDIRLGIDGVMGGYLLLTGSRGIELIDRAVLANPQAADGEITAAISALRFIWEYGGEGIPRERLRQSMRQVLSRPERISLAVADLARWQDWSVVDQLMEIYQNEQLATRHEKTAIIKFLCVAEKTDLSGLSPGQAEAVTRAKEHLRQLREKEPQLVDRAERTPVIR